MRSAFGVTYLLSGTPIDLFFDGGGGPWLSDDGGFSLDYKIGARYWF